MPIHSPSDFDLAGRLLLDRFKVKERLDRGGMGSVWLADDVRFGLPAVIKVPTITLLGEEGFLERFELEVKSLTKLVHPHIVRVHDFGVVDDVPFMAMQYLGGGTLKQRLGRVPRQSPEDVLTWLRPIADALDYMHGKQMLHRDVKPANILFDDADHAHLADFGIAKSLAKTDTGLTRTGASPGTPQYVPPESFDGKPLAPPADQYSLGLIVYEALSGIQAHGGTSLHEILGKKLRPVRPISELAPKLSPQVNAVVMRAIRRDPAKRFPSCKAYAEAFEQAVRTPTELELGDAFEEHGGETEYETLDLGARRPPRRRRRSPWRWIAPVAGVLLLGGAAAWHFRDQLGPWIERISAGSGGDADHGTPPNPDVRMPDQTPPSLLNYKLVGGNAAHRCEEGSVACALTFSEPVRVTGAALRGRADELSDFQNVVLGFPVVDSDEPRDESLTLTATDAAGNAAPAIVHVTLYSGTKHVAAVAALRPRKGDDWETAPAARRRDLAHEFDRRAKEFEATVQKDELLTAPERAGLFADAAFTADRVAVAKFLEAEGNPVVTLDSPTPGARTNQRDVAVKGRVVPALDGSIQLSFDPAHLIPFKLDEEGRFAATVPLPQDGAGRIADGEYVLSVATERGTIVAQPHLFFDATPPAFVAADVKGTPPFRAEAKTVDVEVALSEPGDLFLASGAGKIATVGTTPITLHLELPATDSADPVKSELDLTVKDAAGNLAQRALPVEVFSAKAHVAKLSTELGEPRLDAAAAGLDAQSAALSTWKQKVAADALLTAAEKKDLLAAADRDLAALKQSREHLDEVARQEQQRREQERKAQEDAQKEAQKAQEKHAGPELKSFPGFESLGPPNALGYPRTLKHRKSGVELLAVDFGDDVKPTLYASRGFVSELQYEGRGDGTEPKVSVSAEDIVFTWCAKGGRGEGLALPTDAEWQQLSRSKDPAISKPFASVRSLGGELLRDDGSETRTDWPIRAADGSAGTQARFKTTKYLAFRVVFRVP